MAQQLPVHGSRSTWTSPLSRPCTDTSPIYFSMRYIASCMFMSLCHTSLSSGPKRKQNASSSIHGKYFLAWITYWWYFYHSLNITPLRHTLNTRENSLHYWNLPLHSDLDHLSGASWISIWYPRSLDCLYLWHSVTPARSSLMHHWQRRVKMQEDIPIAYQFKGALSFSSTLALQSSFQRCQFHQQAQIVSLNSFNCTQDRVTLKLITIFSKA